MLADMATEKPTPAEPRKRVLRTHRWNPDLIEACEAYMVDQEVPPTEIAVLEYALREFLVKRGYLAKPKKSGGKAHADAD